ncbi:hypothetical protein [Streptomyces sp. NPDC048442]|uniref:hypothetical protein n=1 Tax=Streptomyces sp. NPDC048442 TaxID=3154823 RepID=UPI003434D7B0
MIVVGQFLRTDFPEIPYPQKMDTLQVFWCPKDHFFEYPNDLEFVGPNVVLEWVSWKSLKDFKLPPLNPNFPPEVEYLVEPCTVSPEQIIEYPNLSELPVEIRDSVEDRLREAGVEEYECELSISSGWKIGGWASWHLTDFQSIECLDCGDAMALLLKADSSEWDGEGERWHPLEDRGLSEEEFENAYAPTKAVLGRHGELRVFVCRANIQHRIILNSQ